MGKGSRAKQKRKKAIKKAKSPNARRKAEYARFSHANAEHARLLKPPKPEPVESHVHDYRTPRSSSSPFVSSFESTWGRTRQRSGLDSSGRITIGRPRRPDSSTTSVSSTSGLSRPYTMADVTSSGLYFRCGIYNFDYRDFERSQIPRLADQLTPTTEGLTKLKIENGEIDVQVSRESTGSYIFKYG